MNRCTTSVNSAASAADCTVVAPPSERPDDDDREHQLPLRRTKWRPAASRIVNAPTGAAGHQPFADAERRQRAEHQHARQETADEQIADRDLGDDAVQNQRKRRREEQAERAGGREQAEREPLAVAVGEQRRHAAVRRARGSSRPIRRSGA